MITLEAYDYDRLRGLKRGAFFRAASDIAGRKIESHPLYKAHLYRFGYRTQERLNEAVGSHQFDRIDPGTKEYDSALRVAHHKQEISRGIARAFLPRDTLGFTPVERSILLPSLTIASLIDEIYRAWRDKVVNSPLGQRMRAMGYQEAATWQGDNDLDNPYAVLEEEVGSMRVFQVAYARAFPEHYHKLDQSLFELISGLGSNRGADEWAEYYRAYRAAATEKDLRRLDERWRQVDYAWMEIKGSFQPVHAMEKYADPAKIRIDPFYGIFVDTEEGEAVKSKALETQARQIKDLKTVFGTFDTFKVSLPALEASTIYAGDSIITSGSGLDFRLAGQTVPNRAEVRLENGVKILLYYSAQEKRFGFIKKLFTEVFGQEAADAELVDPSLRTYGGVLIGGHENIHLIFVTPDTEPRLGVGNKRLAEETKTDMGNTSTVSRGVENREILPEEARLIISELTGVALRDIRSRGSETLKPYYLKSVAYLNMLLDSGIVKKDQERWIYDYTGENANKFLAMVSQTFMELAVAYDSYDSEAVAGFFDKYAKERPEVLDLVRTVKAVPD